MLLSILVVLMFAAVFTLALYDYCKDWINYLRSLYKTSNRFTLIPFCRSAILKANIFF